MEADREFNITLPEELARLVRDKVAAGEYATESEMVSEGLQTLLSQDWKDEGLERWLLAEVIPAYDTLRTHPETARSAAEVRARLRAEHEEHSRS